MSVLTFFTFLGFSLAVLFSLRYLVPPYSKEKLLLSFFFLIIAFWQFTYGFINIKKIDNFVYLSVMVLPSIFLLAPLLFYYYEILVFSKLRKRINLGYFLPAVIPSFLLHYIYIDNYENYSKMLINGILGEKNLIWFIFLCGSTYLLIFGVKIIHMVLQAKRNKILKKSHQTTVIILLGLSFIVFTLTILTPFFVILTIYKVPAMVVSFSFLVFYFLSYRDSHIYSHFFVKKESYAQAKLTDQVKNEIAKKLENQIRQQIFLNEDLSIKKLAKLVHIQRVQLSQYFSEVLETNFNSFINQYRINYANDYIISHPKVKLQQEYYKFGFRSYSAFAQSYKLITGLSPAQYREKL